MEITTCVCGHEIEDHGANGSCQVEGCLCGGYEPSQERDSVGFHGVRDEGLSEGVR